MIISKKYNDELTDFIKAVRKKIFESIDKDINFTNISFLVPVTDEFLSKYNINENFQFIANMNDWDDVNVIINYKGGKIEPDCYWLRPDNYKEPHLLDIFQECIIQDTHKPNIKHMEIEK